MDAERMTVRQDPVAERRVMIVGDRGDARRRLRCAIEAAPGVALCGEPGEAQAALERAQAARPDIVVIHDSPPERIDLELIRGLKSRLPKVEVLVLTTGADERSIREALLAGARGYVLESDLGDRLAEALAALARRQAYFSPAISDALHEMYEAQRAFDVLTPRERQVVRLLAKGAGNDEIAATLAISVKTVETHRSAALRKLGGTPADLARHAERLDLLAAGDVAGEPKSFGPAAGGTPPRAGRRRH
jgi:DNA-binding NarL/FixJ family response regulator